MLAYLTVFAVTLLGCEALTSTRRWHGRFSLDSDFGVQKVHQRPTARIGGLALMIGLVVTLVTADDDVRALLSPMLLAAIPAFVFGLAEDLTKSVSVRARLLATMFSGVAAWYLTGVSMQETGLPPLDWVLRFTPAAVMFTAFAVGGVANAVNIIDGLNGLAAGAVAIMLGAISLIALQLGDTALSTVCLIVATSALAFGVVNWPLGRLFMGDGGAYLLGFLLAWTAVLLPMRHAQINGWATILVCAYPVLEVGFSVRRRRKRVGHHPGQPDRLHLHHLIHRRIVCLAFPRLSPALKNGLTSPICWLLVALPAGAAVVFAQNTLALALLFVLAVFAYGAIYARLTQFRWCLSAVTLLPGRHLHALSPAITRIDE
jgi:UDP-N-acetylmuramyl pentapeptide phosphotransferase/UDP-N-acetylglucosamine-1-phosphate transferase